MNLEEAKTMALKLGAQDLMKSKVKGKRFAVKYNNKIINFGLDNPSIGTYFDLKKVDPELANDRRKQYRARHGVIKLKNGSLAYKDKNSPAFWAWHVLW